MKEEKERMNDKSNETLPSKIQTLKLDVPSKAKLYHENNHNQLVSCQLKAHSPEKRNNNGQIYKIIDTQRKQQKKTLAVRLTKPLSDDDSWVRHGFGSGGGVKTSVPLTQSTPAVSYNTTRLY